MVPCRCSTTACHLSTTCHLSTAACRLSTAAICLNTAARQILVDVGLLHMCRHRLLTWSMEVIVAPLSKGRTICQHLTVIRPNVLKVDALGGTPILLTQVAAIQP